MPKVYNRKYGAEPAGAVYVGRPSKFGNLFSIGKDGYCADVLRKYREYLESRPDIVEAVKTEFKGKDLVCWCSPKPCHADILLDIANSG